MTNAINNLLLAIWPSNTSNEQLDLCALPGITAGIGIPRSLPHALVGAAPLSLIPSRPFGYDQV